MEPDMKKENKIFGLAVDIGTANVTCCLVDLITSKEICILSKPNSQLICFLQEFFTESCK
jgi:uncharacterized 2Fe-2S/4Fe-4S cluster protein (DUF4445 family)